MGKVGGRRWAKHVLGGRGNRRDVLLYDVGSIATHLGEQDV